MPGGWNLDASHICFHYPFQQSFLFEYHVGCYLQLSDFSVILLTRSLKSKGNAVHYIFRSAIGNNISSVSDHRLCSLVPRKQSYLNDVFI